MLTIPNIEFRSTKKNPTIDSPTSEFELPFYKDVDYFTNMENFVNFVRAVEKLVRSSKYYDRYIKYIKEDIGLKQCQVLSNVVDENEGKDITIEMHHGPILTLFDYAAILTDHCLNNGIKVTTFRVADMLCEEHFQNNVQVVMLSKTVHEQVHLNTVFVNINQGFGDLNRFLNKYRDGLQPEQVKKINNYIAKSKEYDSFDNGALELDGFVKSWNKTA